MISFDVNGGLGPLLDALARLTDGLDLKPLAEQARVIAVEDNRRARLAGVDRDGLPLAPLRGGRTLRPSELRARGGSGPPLAPRGDASGVISGFVCEVVPGPDGTVLVRGTWPALAYLTYHAQGAGRNPVRDVAGVTPEGVDRIADATREFVAEKVGLY